MSRGSHWTYWLQILSQLCLQRVYFFENFEIVAISTDKNTFLMAILIKLTLDNIFIKVKKNLLGRRHCHLLTPLGPLGARQ